MMVSNHDTGSQTLVKLRDQLNIHQAVQPTYGRDTTMFGTTFVMSELRLAADHSFVDVNTSAASASRHESRIAASEDSEQC